MATPAPMTAPALFPRLTFTGEPASSRDVRVGIVAGRFAAAARRWRQESLRVARPAAAEWADRDGT